jgi:hypothetical protein
MFLWAASYRLMISLNRKAETPFLGKTGIYKNAWGAISQKEFQWQIKGPCAVNKRVTSEETKDFCRGNLKISTRFPWLVFWLGWVSPQDPCLLFIFIIHMCIQGLGHFSPLPPPPPLPPTLPSPSPPPPPQYPAETILPLSLILLKKEYKQ